MSTEDYNDNNEQVSHLSKAEQQYIEQTIHIMIHMMKPFLKEECFDSPASYEEMAAKLDHCISVWRSRHVQSWVSQAISPNDLPTGDVLSANLNRIPVKDNTPLPSEAEALDFVEKFLRGEL